MKNPNPIDVKTPEPTPQKPSGLRIYQRLEPVSPKSKNIDETEDAGKKAYDAAMARLKAKLGDKYVEPTEKEKEFSKRVEPVYKALSPEKKVDEAEEKDKQEHPKFPVRPPNKGNPYGGPGEWNEKPKHIGNRTVYVKKDVEQKKTNEYGMPSADDSEPKKRVKVDFTDEPGWDKDIKMIDKLKKPIKPIAPDLDDNDELTEDGIPFDTKQYRKPFTPPKHHAEVEPQFPWQKKKTEPKLPTMAPPSPTIKLEPKHNVELPKGKITQKAFTDKPDEPKTKTPSSKPSEIDEFRQFVEDYTKWQESQ